MNSFFKNQKGINLISLSIAVIIILALTGTTLYNVKSNLGVENLKNMQSDIENLKDKIDGFYIKYGKIPASLEYTDSKGNISKIRNSGVISAATDTGKFYIIDLSAIDNLTLNYGEDYKSITSTSTQDEIDSLKDIYIINEDSHNIFFVRGIKFDNEWFYTNYTSEDIDTKSVNLITIDGTKESWSPQYDITATYKDENGDTATIPKGFQVSRKTGENVINTGLVVRASDESEFVWVPVADINTMSQCETAGGDCNLELSEDGHLRCTNLDHSATAESIVGKLYAIDCLESFGTVNTSYSADSGLREPAIVTGSDGSSYDADTTNKYYEKVGYTSAEAMLEGLKQGYKAMAESVAKNGGFYIGRYETSLSSATESSAGTTGTVQSKAGVIPTAADNSATYTWYGLYQVQKGLSNSDYTSSMIWGSQYDAMLNWVKNGTGTDKSKITDNSGIGNNTGSLVKTTGNNNYSNDSINNIRDLAGNLYEWTLDASEDSYRLVRGGCFNDTSSPSNRINWTPEVDSNGIGSRLTLYIN